MVTAARREYVREAEDDHGCGDLPEDVCREVPGNAARIIGAQTLQSIGDRIVDAKAVLPWLLAAVAAPPGLVGLLVPIRESGSLLPQAALVPWVRRQPLRKWLWIAGAAGQATAVAAMALAAGTLSGTAAGGAVLVALAGFALARALTSIASKDVLGRTVPKGQRGRVNGLATTASGAVAIVLGLALRAFGGGSTDPLTLALLLLAAAAAWVLAALVFSTVREPVSGEDAALRVGWFAHMARLLRDDPPFRRFVLTRTLLLVSALSPPFVVSWAAAEAGVDLAGLGLFVSASGVANLLGGWWSGRLADRSSRRLLMVAAATASLLIFALLAAATLPPLRTAAWLFPLAYLLLLLTHTAARVARKTYVVDLARGNRRTDYVAVSNTAMGVLLLVAGAVSAALGQWDVQAALMFLALLGVAGVAVARTLPEVN